MDLCLSLDPGHEIFPVTLPVSKSELARLLMISAYSGKRIRTGHTSGNCDDISIMRRALREIGRQEDVNIGASGTAMRFLTSYAASLPGARTRLHGDARMEQRPIGPLVDALRSLGADISYEKKDGFPPLLINGMRLSGGKTTLPGDISSQYISSLLLLAPRLDGPLEITVTGPRVLSHPYLDMTRALMARAGVPSEEKGRIFRVPEKEYRPMREIVPRPDWSAASYFYSFAALTGREITLKGLGNPAGSLQGDARLAVIFKSFGVTTSVKENGDVVLSPASRRDRRIDIDIPDNPDLLPALAVTAAGLGMNFRFSGVRTLRLKESDRLEALSAEMRKLGFIFSTDLDSIRWGGERCEPESVPVISTYNDHRIAMALSMAVCFRPGIIIRNAQVVKKSFLKFWHQVSLIGIRYKIREKEAEK